MTRNRSRRTPVQQRARQKYEAVLAAVPQVLKRDGYAGVTTDKIAVEAGVPIGTLYQYFEDKDSIIACYLDAELERVMKSVDGAAAPEPGLPLREMIRGLVDASVAFVQDNREILQTAIREVPGFVASPTIERAEQRIFDVVRSLAWLMPGRAEESNVRLMGYVLTNAVFGFLFRSVIQLPPDVSREEISGEIQKLIAGYLEKSGVDLDRSF